MTVFLVGLALTVMVAYVAPFIITILDSISKANYYTCTAMNKTVSRMQLAGNIGNVTVYYCLPENPALKAIATPIVALLGILANLLLRWEVWAMLVGLGLIVYSYEQMKAKSAYAS
jgi:hypothetical protein